MNCGYRHLVSWTRRFAADVLRERVANLLHENESHHDSSMMEVQSEL